MMEVLLSEVAGSDRWNQFNLKLAWVQPFFGVPHDVGATIGLCTIGLGGTIISQDAVTTTYKAISKNWVFNIPNTSHMDYPGYDRRPILAVSQRDDGIFSYDLVMPDEGRYANVAEFLENNRQTPNGELARLRLLRTDILPQLAVLSI